MAMYVLPVEPHSTDSSTHSWDVTDLGSQYPGQPYWIPSWLLRMRNILYRLDIADFLDPLRSFTRVESQSSNSICGLVPHAMSLSPSHCFFSFSQWVFRFLGH